MKSLILIVMVTANLLAWDCTMTDKKTGGKKADVFCRNLTMLVAAGHLDEARIKMGIGYSQATESVKSDIATVLMEQAEQCYVTCMSSLGSRM